LKHIPFSVIYKEFNTFFLENYKIKKINFFYEQYFNKTKEMEKLIYFLKKLIVDFNFFKKKRLDNRLFFFKKYYINFVSKQTNFI
jgi:hypothetical protein